MGIEKTEGYVCACDNCGMYYESDDLFLVFPDAETAIDTLINCEDWIKDGDKLYCDECYILDDNGLTVIDESRKIVESEHKVNDEEKHH